MITVGHQALPVFLMCVCVCVFTGVQSIGYSGSYPVSKLSVKDDTFHGMKLDLFAHSAIYPRDSVASATPAITFTLHVKNPTKETTHVSFMLNLPLGIQKDTARFGNVKKSFKMKTADPAECATKCAAQHDCISWSVAMGTKEKTCALKDSLPLHSWKPGFISGVKGTWTVQESMLTLNRPGNFPQSGNTTLLAVTKARTSFMVGNDFRQIWHRFSNHGSFHSHSHVSRMGFYGAIAMTTSVPAGQERSLSFVMGWFYPNRDFTGTMIIFHVLVVNYEEFYESCCLSGLKAIFISVHLHITYLYT